MKSLPLARSSNIVVQTLGNEVLIYDLETHKAFTLNETSSIVYQACDGRTSFDELKGRAELTDDIIFLALDQLKKENLLADNDKVEINFNGLSRREVIRKAGLASMVALPIVASLVAPTPAMAQSCTGGGNFCACTITEAQYDSGVRDCPSTDCAGGCICKGSTWSDMGATYQVNGTCGV